MFPVHWPGRVAIIFVLFSAVSASAADRQIQFDPPREVSVRNKSRVVVRGSLVRFDRTGAVLEIAGREGSESRQLEISIAQIASLRTTDGKFRYLAGEDVNQLIATTEREEGILIVDVNLPGLSDAPETPVKMVPPPLAGDAPRTESSPVASTEPPEKEMTAQKPELELGEVREVIICGNCRKEVELTSKYGQKCPHCGIEWAVPVAIPKVDATADAAATGGEFNNMPGGLPHGDAQVVGAPQRNGPQQLDVPPAPIPNSGVQQELDFATLPLWMKATLFFGSLGVIYYLFFIR